MKRKLKRTLILVFLAVASLFILAGCSFKYATREEVVEDYGLEASVTYYGNGGVFENNLGKKTIDYFSGQPAINIGVDKMKPQRTIKRDDYTFDGWYYVVLDENNNPTYTDETQTYFVLGEPVDFTKILEADEHWIVAASWKSNAKVQIMLVVEEGMKISNPDTEAEQKEFANGDLIATRKFDNDGTLAYVSDTFKFNMKDDKRAFTLLDYYTDETCQTRVQWPIAKSNAGDTVIYAKYLVGAWELVKDVSGVDKMFKAIRANTVKVKGYWIYDDIDMLGQPAIQPFTKFNAAIHSDGATIKNLTVDKSGVTDKATTSLFGKIGEKAELVNVNFENLTFSCSSNASEFNAYFVFESLSETARIENVKIQGTFNITVSERNGTLVANMKSGYENCLFGGYTTDEAYLTASAGNGFKVLGTIEEIVKVTQGI